MANFGDDCKSDISSNKLSPTNTTDGGGYLCGDGIDAISANSATSVPSRNIVGQTMIATIGFETKEALDRVYNALESDNGIEFCGYLLVVVQNSRKTAVK